MIINNDTIVKDTDPKIRQKSLPVQLPLSEEDKTVLKEMFQYVVDSTDEEKAEKLNLRPAVGISAIQIGIPKQLTAIVFDDIDKNDQPVRHEFMLANPRIVSASVQKAYLKGGEGCLSVEEEHEGYVVRSARVKVRAYDLIRDREIEIRARGYLAIVLQHEIDHFSGILFYDRISEKDPFEEIEGALVI